MKPQRRLALRREHLTDLDAYDLRAVIGGTHIRTDCGCVTHGNTCDACNILTLPINRCTTIIAIDVTDGCVHVSGVCA